MERAIPPLKFDHSQIEQASRQYFKNGGSLQSFELLSGGAVNSAFKILWDDQEYVLRFYTREKALATFEQHIYRLIKDVIPVPELLFVSSENEVYPFALFRFCKAPHISDVQQKFSHPLSYDLGKTLAQIHNFRFPQAGLLEGHLSIKMAFAEDSSPYYDYCVAHLTPGSNTWKRLGEARSQMALQFMRMQRAYFPIVQKGGCLVHSDFKPVNLLWDEHQGLTVLDWEFAHSGDGLLDFGILLRHFQDFPLSMRHLEKGYRENGGHLPSHWIPRARITDFVNIIQLLNTPANQPKLFSSLIESLDFTMRSWETLESTLTAL